MAKNKRAFSVNYRKPVFIDSNDPRVKDLDKYKSRIGREVILRDLPNPIKLERNNP